MDMCDYENDPAQDSYRCAAYEEFNTRCDELFTDLKLVAKFNWRIPANCRKLILSYR